MGQLVAMKHIKNPDQQNAWELHGDPLRDLSFYHYDALGSVAMTTGKNGQAIERYEYDVYGNAYDGWFSHNTHNDNPYGFTGQRYDRELGIYNFAYRDYNPHAMRWMTPDPVKDGMNWYGYVGSDPVNYVDPLGLTMEESQTWQQELVHIKIDPGKVSNMTRRNIEYLFEKVLAGEDDWLIVNGQKQAWLTAEDFERALDRQFELLQNPKYVAFEKTWHRIEHLTDGALQTTGGVTQTMAGWRIMVAPTGPFRLVTIPAGGIVAADGISNAREGLGKAVDSIFTPVEDDAFHYSLNPIRDLGFKRVLGDEKGDLAYNWFTLTTGVVAFGKSEYDLYKSGAVKNVLRKPQMRKATNMNIPLKTKVIEFGDKLIIHSVQANSNSATPMITQKVIIDLKELSRQGKYFLIDVRNGNGTIGNIMGND